MIWFGILCCFLVSFVFSGIEAGILSMNRVRLKHRLKLRDRAAIKLNRLLDQPERLLVTVLIVTNLMNIFAITLATQEIVARLGARIGYPVAFALFLPIYLVGLELLPKSLFRRFPYRLVATLTGPLRFADSLLSPIHAVGGSISNLLSGERTEKPQKLFLAREDFKYLTIESERVGTLSTQEREVIHQVIDFRALRASDLMIPRAQIQTVAAHASLEELIGRSAEANRERWAVSGEDGRIVGMVDLFDVAIDGRRRGIVEMYMRRAVYVPAEESAYNVLRKLRAARVTLAVVEQGAEQVGLVAWDDLVKRFLKKG